VIASEFYSNTSRGAGGGGIFVQSGGQVTIEQSQIFSNAVSAGPGGGIYMVGSASSHSALTMTQSSVFSNTASSSGGGIWSNDYSRLTMSDSRLTGNTSGNNGGGFHGGGGVTLQGVYVAQNRASNQGGGFYFANTNNTYGALLWINESTFFNNTAVGGVGGGIRGFSGNIELENSVVYSNTVSGHS
jgi:hypothetical protein